MKKTIPFESFFDDFKLFEDMKKPWTSGVGVVEFV